jgi:hypothetical protein
VHRKSEKFIKINTLFSVVFPARRGGLKDPALDSHSQFEPDQIQTCEENNYSQLYCTEICFWAAKVKLSISAWISILTARPRGQKSLLLKVSTLFSVSEVRHFQCSFDDNVSAIHVFTDQILRAADKAPSASPSPTVMCRGGASSRSFYPEAVSLVMSLKQCGLGLKFSNRPPYELWGVNPSLPQSTNHVHS